MKYVTYKPAELYSKGEKWYVYYSYRNPQTGKFDRFKVYEDINRVPEKDRLQFGKNLIEAVNLALQEGYNPFTSPLPEKKVWTLQQCLNYYRQNLPDLEIGEMSYWPQPCFNLIYP